MAALLVCHAAAADERAVRGRAAALDLDVHQVRHALADDPGRRRRDLHPHAADLHLHAHLLLLRGRARLRHGGADVPDAGGGDRGLFLAVAAGGAAVTRGFALFNVRGQLVALAVAALVVFAAFPFAWMALTAFKPSPEIFITPPTLLPRQPTLANLERLFAETRFLVYLRNSLVVAISTVVLTLAVATPAAYSLTRFVFPGRDKVAAMILFTYMFAPIMIIVPFYVMMRYLGLTNSHVGLVLAYTTFCLPFNLWLLRTSFQSIPVEIEEAALIDGANRLQSVRYVVLPLALPGVVATGIFTFILAWNDYIFARVLLSADELKTLPIGIADLYNASVVDWGMIMAAGLLVIAPVLGVFVVIQRYMVTGWGAGGVKG